jgi:hypothetical protein
MTTTNEPGPRPAPHLISFAPECFATVGERTVYAVAFPAPRYPERFDSREAAEERARKCGRTVTAHAEPVRVRVKWN